MKKIGEIRIKCKQAGGKKSEGWAANMQQGVRYAPGVLQKYHLYSLGCVLCIWTY